MTTYHARPYAGEADYARLRGLITECYRLSGPPAYFTLGDLDWWRAGEDDPDAIAQDVPDTGGAELNPVPSDNADTLAQFSTATQPAIALDEDQQRATAIIQGSTATAAFAMTATQQALFGGQPFMTATPSLDPTVAGATSAPVLSGADCIDEVRAGDNLFRIALRYGLTVGDIASRNGITNVDLIFPGQMLTIPGCGTTGYRPLPTTIPTTSPVTTTTGGTTGGTTTGGGIFITFTPAPGVPSTTTTGGGTGTCGTHVVTEGETLFQIAQANGSTVSAIASANGIVNVDLIDMGMSLNVPC